MNASSSDVVAPASTELTTPAKSTPNPTTAIAAAASQALREASVPRHDERRAGERERGLRLQALAHRAAEVDQQQHRERAERRERRQHRVADHLLAEREQRRHDDRGASGPAQRGQIAIAPLEPLQWVRQHASPHAVLAVTSAR